MIALDIRTVFVTSIILMTASAGVLASLWRQNRDRMKGLDLWLLYSVLQALAVALFALRDVIPDLFSIVIGNAFVVIGAIALYRGLREYLNVTDSPWWDYFNYAIGAACILVNTYFTYARPDLEIRAISTSLLLTVVSAESAWLLLRRADRAVHDTGTPGTVIAALALMNAVRVLVELFGPKSTDLLQSGPFNAAVLLGLYVLTIVLAFGLLLMVNRRLVSELEDDIRERDEARAALALSEAKFATAFRVSPDAVNINRLSDGLYIDINEGFTTLTGYTSDDVAGLTSADIDVWVDPGDRSRLVARLQECGVARNLEAEFRRKDGSTVTGLMSAQVIDVNGEPCILSVTRDISDRKHAEDEIRRLNLDLEARVQERTEELTAANEQLLEANTQLDEATRAKSDFLASMSHELRTPLNSVIGFSDLLARGMAGELEAEQLKQVRMINASGKYLLELVNEVLDLSAIEAGRMRIEREELDIPAIVDAVIETVAPLAANRGLELSMAVQPGAERLISDGTRLEQVLFNIVGNAIKFTETGSVSINVRPEPGAVVFEVRDTGPGIAPSDLPRIFEEFYQVERRDVAKSEGTGLGLTVSRRLVEMLGGDIDVQSRPGEGSVFSIRLPAPHA